MKTSIALTTYNGKKNIIELLDSIRAQTEAADEVIIVDDCSSDGTYQCLQEYIRRYELDDWYLFENNKNVGWKVNFRNAFSKCSGDLIFPCDQDDVWKDYKVQEMKRVMEDERNILLLLSNYDEMNEDRNDRIVIKGLNKDDSSVEKSSFSYASLIEMRPGCVTCFRREILEMMKKKDDLSLPHDTVVWGYSAINNGTALFNRITILYRRHSDSATAPKSAISREKKIADLEIEMKAHEFFYERCCEKGDLGKKMIIESQLDFYKKRIQYIEAKKTVHCLSYAIKHHDHYATKRNLLSDIVASLL